MPSVKPWQEVASDVQSRISNSIPSEWTLKELPAASQLNVMGVPASSGLLSAKELEITEKDAVDLVSCMASAQLTSHEVTLAFCKRAAIAHQLLNCLTQAFFDEALDYAKSLDETLKTTGKPVGPLHGLPFSIKTHWSVKGKEASSAYVAKAYDLSDQDAASVEILRKAGAVLFCKTTAPQTLMHLETVSNLFGRTLNPFNRDLSPGGSSGGESALVSFRGSPMGLSADGGGSIRVPAAHCGLIGLKSTSDRIPMDGFIGCSTGISSFPIVNGVVCHSVRDAKLFMKTIIDAQPWLTEPELPPIPWRDVQLKPKITFGIYMDDGLCRPHPPIENALKKLKSLLIKAADVDVVEFKPFNHAQGYDIIRSIYFQDGGKANYDLFDEAGETCLPLSAWVMKEPQTRRRTLEETWSQHAARETFRKDYQAYWAKNYPQVDFLICPCFPGTAAQHETSKCWSYTAIFNCLDWPACAFPTGDFVNPEEHPQPEYKPRDNEFDSYNWSLYAPEKYRGGPISLQLVGKKWHCEEVLEAVQLVQDIIKASKL